MNFFRMIKMDFKRMFLSGKFYFAIAGAMLVTVLNISQEAMQSRWNVSVYYLVVSSHGVGAFFEVFSVLAVLPFARKMIWKLQVVREKNQMEVATYDT